MKKKTDLNSPQSNAPNQNLGNNVDSIAENMEPASSTGLRSIRTIRFNFIVSTAILLLVFVITASTLQSLDSSNTITFFARLVIGIIGLFFVPGFFLTRFLVKEGSLVEVIGFSLVFGTAIQMINVLALYAITPFLNGSVNTYLALIAFTAVTITAFAAATFVREWGSTQESRFLQTSGLWTQLKAVRMELLLFIIFGLALGLRLYFQSFSLGPATDGASYLDYARNVVQSGTFTSRIIDANPNLAEAFLTGLSSHVGAPFGLSIFFEIGGISYLSGKVMAVFFGCLLIFPVYKIGKDLFSAEVGIIASVIVAVHPFFLEYSSMLYGPEMMSACFVAIAFYFLVSAIQKPQIWKASFAAVFAFLTLITWFPTFYIFVLIAPFLFFLINQDRIAKLAWKPALVGILIVAFWFVTFQFSANLPLGLVFHVGTLAILVPLLLWKRNVSWVRILCVLLITLNIIIEIYWIRSFFYSGVFIASTSSSTSTVTSALAGRVQFEDIPNLLNRFSSKLVPAYMDNVSAFLIISSIISFVILKDWKKKCAVLLFPLAQIFFYGISIPDSILVNIGGIENRLLLPTTIFFAILTALLISQADTLNLVATKRVFRFRKRALSFSGSILAILIVLSAMYVAEFYPQNITVINHIKSANTNVLYNLDPAINWVNANTSKADILATRKPYEWAWYTGRETVIFNQTTNFDELLAAIKQCKVNYMIVDPVFNDYFTNLREFYISPENSPEFMPMMLNYNNPDGSKIIIFNTTRIISSGFKYESRPLSNFDNNTEWNLSYGNFSIDYVSPKEGNSSLKIVSQVSPSAAGQNKSVAKVYENISPSNFSKASSIEIWVKANASLNGKIFLQIFDTNNNWGMFNLPQPSGTLNEWYRVKVSINSFAQFSTPKPDLSMIYRIVLGVVETPVPFTVWFDQLSIVYLIEMPTAGSE
jgi:hypothetical protein